MKNYEKRGMMSKTSLIMQSLKKRLCGDKKLKFNGPKSGIPTQTR